MTTKLKNKSGMTIVEVVVAMAIIAVSTAIMCSGISTSLNIIRKSADLINNIAENKSSLFENIAENKTENINQTSIQFNGKNYNIYELKSENDSGALLYYSTKEATLNTRGMIQCFIETYDKLSNNALGVVLTKNSVDYSENSDASNAFIHYLSNTYGIDANKFYWRIVKDVSDGAYKIAMTEELNPYIDNGYFVKVDLISVKIGSTNYSNVTEGYCQFKNVHPSNNSFNSGNDYNILDTISGPDVDADTFFTKNAFSSAENGAMLFNLFNTLCVSNNYSGNVNSDNCPDALKQDLKNHGIDTDKIVFNYSFNEGKPTFSLAEDVEKSDINNNDYVQAQIARIVSGKVTFNSGVSKVTKDTEGITISSKLMPMSIFDDKTIFKDNEYSATLKNMFKYFMLNKRMSSSTDSENASDKVNNGLKDATGIDYENSLWLFKRDEGNNKLVFKYSTALSLTEMKYGSNYKKYSNILVRTISAKYDYTNDEWSYTNGYSQLKYTDGSFVLSDKNIALNKLSDEEAVVISAIENGWFQNGMPNKADGESGYSDSDGDKTVNDTTAGKIIRNAKENFDIDLSAYYWRISDKGDLLTFVKKSDVPTDSEGNPDASKAVKAIQIKLSTLKKEEVEANIIMEKDIYVINF